MIKTVVMLEESVYEWLVRESIRRYGNSKNISKVLNEILKKYFGSKGKIFKVRIKVPNLRNLGEIEEEIKKNIFGGE